MEWYWWVVVVLTLLLLGVVILAALFFRTFADLVLPKGRPPGSAIRGP